MNTNYNTTQQAEANKTEFQNTVKKIESDLSEYKTSYPKNFGDVFRANIMLFCISIAIYCILSAVAFFNVSTAMMAFMVGLPLLIISIKFNDTPSEGYSKRRQVLSGQRSLQKLDEFPDVKNYLQGLDTELEAVEKRKETYKRTITILFWLFSAVLLALLVRSFVNDNTFLRDDLENIHSGDNCGDFTEIAPYFHLEDHKPFVSISPLDASLSPSNADLFIVNLNTGSGNQADDCLAGFRFAVPEIKDATANSRYILTITDKDGNPSELSFEFNTSDKYIQKRIATREPKALNIAYYIYTHSNELRYKVEPVDN
jgi:hypothetical protein